MDPNIPPSFTSLPGEDNSPQIGGNITGPITPTNPYMSYPSYPSPNYRHHMYQPYYLLQPDLRNQSGGLDQNPRNYPPSYYLPPHNDANIVHHNEYLYYPPYYHRPPPPPNYISVGSNSTPSSTPTRSMESLGNSGSGSSKRSYPDAEEAVDEVVGGGGRPERRKAVKRRLKEKTNNTIVDLVTTQLKELRSSNSEMIKMFQDWISIIKEEKTQKMMMRERKLRLKEDRIMMMDTSTMTPEKKAYYEQKRREIMQRISGQSSSTQ